LATLVFFDLAVVLGRLQMVPQSARTVARQLTGAATAASDTVVGLADSLECGCLSTKSLPLLPQLDGATLLRSEPGDGVTAGRVDCAG
jgi:hypothetical protein